MTPKQLAETVKTQLLAAEFSLTPESIQRVYSPEMQLGVAATLQLVVVPAENNLERNDETAFQRTTSIDVGVLYKFNVRDRAKIPNETIDPLMEFATELADWFCADEYEAPADMVVERVDHIFLFDPNHLRKWRQFTSVIRVSFMGAW